MSRDRSAAATPLPPLAHGGRLTQLAAERFPIERAPMNKGDRAAFWLGEYVKARRELPHLKPSDLLALIAEQDIAACGATFTRTIKQLAQQHLGDRTKATPSPAPNTRRKVPASVSPTASPPPAGSTAAAVPPPTPPSRHDVIVGALELDVIAVWRLTMTQIAARTSLGAEVQRIIDAHLARWLRSADFAAAATHLAALNASGPATSHSTTH